MVFGRLFGSKKAGVDELIARRKYKQAIELLRDAFDEGRRDATLRLQLADVLVLSGRPQEALPIFKGVADEFAIEGFASKAITVLKKMQDVAPGLADVEEPLARLLKAAPAEADEDESGDEAQPGGFSDPFAASAPAWAAPEPTSPEREPDLEPPPPEPPAPAPVAPDVEPVSSAAPAADEGYDALGGDLLSVISDVLNEPAGAAASDVEELELGIDAIEPEPTPDARSPLFGSLSEDELVAMISGLELRTFEAGDVIITQGETGQSMYILTEGTAKVFVKNDAGHHTFSKEMHEGEFFGEISLLTGQTRTATVTAKTRCELLEMDRANLDEITERLPHVREVLERFCKQRLATA